jgi:hypothetical protein
MRHRLVVLTAVLVITSVAACSRDKNDRPTPQAQPPAASVSSHPGMAFTSLPSAGQASAGQASAGQASAGPNSATRPTTPTDPAGAALGEPMALPSGTVISATGIGPYTIGQEQASLTAAKLVGPVRNGSTGCDTGTGQAKWGSPTLIFTKGKLQHLKITSAAVRTTGGIKVGSTQASVHSAYRKGSAVGATAWYAPTGDFALLFRMSGGQVSTIEAGPASTLSVAGDTSNC